MTTYPLGDRKGLLVVHSLYQNCQHNSPAQAPLEQYHLQGCRQLGRFSDDWQLW